MMHFFEVYKALEHKQTVVDEVCDAAEARRIVEYCINKYVDSFCK
jgi:inorganic pyrophosphatase